MVPRRQGLSVIEGSAITRDKAGDPADAAGRCWTPLTGCVLKAFASAFADSFSAQIAMFPAMIQPGVGEFIEAVKKSGALAWEMLGAGGGGHLLVVLPDGAELPDRAIPVKIRR